MSQSAINLVHIMKPEKRTVPGTGLRIGFFRAWVLTVSKVLFIVAFWPGSQFASAIEENVTLMDQYLRNDYSSYETTYLRQLPRRINTPIIITANFEPRGTASITEGSVASAQSPDGYESK
jgi:hypothetical protein